MSSSFCSMATTANKNKKIINKKTKETTSRKTFLALPKSQCSHSKRPHFLSMGQLFSPDARAHTAPSDHLTHTTHTTVYPQQWGWLLSYNMPSQREEAQETYTVVCLLLITT